MQGAYLACWQSDLAVLHLAVSQHHMEGIQLFHDGDRAIWTTPRIPEQFAKEL
jgi:hypothetical protein